MTSSIISILSSVASLVAMIFGDKLLTKWVGAYQLWYRKYTTKEFQERVDNEYARLEAEWENLNKP
jgi:thiaminase